MLEKNALKVEVTHLRTESELMRYTHDQISHQEEDGPTMSLAAGAPQQTGAPEAALTGDSKAIADGAQAIQDGNADALSESESSAEEVGPSAPQAIAAPQTVTRSADPNASGGPRPMDAKTTGKLTDTLSAHLQSF